jgi:hypothetical protein
MTPAADLRAGSSFALEMAGGLPNSDAAFRQKGHEQPPLGMAIHRKLFTSVFTCTEDALELDKRTLRMDKNSKIALHLPFFFFFMHNLVQTFAVALQSTQQQRQDGVSLRLRSPYPKQRPL